MSTEMMGSGRLGDRWELIGRLAMNSAALPGLEAPRVRLRTLPIRALEIESGTQPAALTASQHETSKLRQAKTPMPTLRFAVPAPATHAGGKT